MSEVSNPERGHVAAQTLDGGWFRKERERIAIGRKGIALRLGTSESKVTTLEMRKHDVPLEWFGVLRELGFRFPEGMNVAPSVLPLVTAEVVLVEEIPAPQVVAETVVEAVPAVPAAATAVAAADVVVDAVVVEESKPAPASAPSEPATTPAVADVVVVPPVVAAPTSATPAAVVEIQESASPPADAQTLGAAKPTASPSSASLTPFFGHWLRERRREKGTRTQDIVKQLRTLPADLYTIERHNIRLPLRWIPGLLKLGLLTVEEAKVATRGPGSKLSTMNGLWLRKQRAQFQLSPKEVGAKLGVSSLDIRLIEARQWSVPSEWFPALKTLFTTPAKSTAKKTTQTKPASVTKASASKPAAATPSTKSKPAAPVGEKAKGSAVDAKPSASAKAPVVDKSASKSSGRKVPAAAPAKTTKPAVSKAAEKPVAVKAAAKSSAKEAKPTEAAKSSASVEPSLTETIVSYRLMLGQHAGLPAVDVLKQIAIDLQHVRGKEALTFDRLRAAMKVLTSR